MIVYILSACFVFTKTVYHKPTLRWEDDLPYQKEDKKDDELKNEPDIVAPKALCWNIYNSWDEKFCENEWILGILEFKKLKKCLKQPYKT